MPIIIGNLFQLYPTITDSFVVENLKKNEQKHNQNTDLKNSKTKEKKSYWNNFLTALSKHPETVLRLHR